MNATTPIDEALRLHGPDRCERLPAPEARAYCRDLARRRGENFSVLSPLVPAPLVDDFAAVYAFCRWADDLGDEAGAGAVAGATLDDAARRARRLELLGWWRTELHACFAGEPRHPVYAALRETVVRHDLPVEPFERLIEAFEQDQSQTRYATWEELLGYCRRSADPVGRLVLMLLGEPRTEAYFRPSDAVCTALQLTNHWQDIARDKLERDRVYVPRELNPIEDFDARLERSARQGWACDRTFLGESRAVVRQLVDRTWPLFEEGSALLPMLEPRSRPVVWLFVAGGTRVLRSIEAWNYETVLHRPRLGTLAKLGLVARAWVAARLARRGGQGPQATRMAVGGAA